MYDEELLLMLFIHGVPIVRCQLKGATLQKTQQQGYQSIVPTAASFLSCLASPDGRVATWFKVCFLIKMFRDLSTIPEPFPFFVIFQGSPSTCAKPPKDQQSQATSMKPLHIRPRGISPDICQYLTARPPEIHSGSGSRVLVQLASMLSN